MLWGHIQIKEKRKKIVYININKIESKTKELQKILINKKSYKIKKN